MASPSPYSHPLPLILSSFSFSLSRLSCLRSSQRRGGDPESLWGHGSLLHAVSGRERVQEFQAGRTTARSAAHSARAAAATRGSRVSCAPEARSGSPREGYEGWKVSSRLRGGNFNPPSCAPPYTLLPYLARGIVSLRSPDFSLPRARPEPRSRCSFSERSRVQNTSPLPSPRPQASRRPEWQNKVLGLGLAVIYLFVFEHHPFLSLGEEESPKSVYNAKLLSSTSGTAFAVREVNTLEKSGKERVRVGDPELPRFPGITSPPRARARASGPGREQRRQRLRVQGPRIKSGRRRGVLPALGLQPSQPVGMRHLAVGPRGRPRPLRAT